MRRQPRKIKSLRARRFCRAVASIASEAASPAPHRGRFRGGPM